MKESVGVELNALVSKAIEIYNRYRSPEATVKLVRAEKDGFILDFKGAFCQSCGVNDYFEDFLYELETLNGSLKLRIKEITPTGPQSFMVHYVFNDDFLGADIEEVALLQEFLCDKGLSFRYYLESNACTKDVIKFHFQTWLFERNQPPENSDQ